MNSPEPSSPAPVSQERTTSRTNRKTRWIVLVVVCVIGLGATAWFTAPRLKKAWRIRQARELTTKADALMQKGQPEEAFRYLAEAVRNAPSEPATLRMMARCLDELPGAELSTVRCWNELHHTGAATWEDTVAMGQAALKSNNLSRAREIEAALPKEIHHQRKVREFRASVLGKAGKIAEAKQLMREVWTDHRDDPECRIKLATLDVKSPDSAVKEAAVAILWEGARGAGKESVFAMFSLSEAGTLDSTKLAELAMLAKKSPFLKDDQRYQIFDSCVAKSPELLPTVIALAREFTSLGKTGSRERFYQWVSTQDQPDVILTEIPESEAMNSRGLFLARADSLMRKGMWEELRRMLDGRMPPVSRVDLELMRAFLARSEQGKDEAVRSHLKGAMLYASGNTRASALAQVGAGAEVLGHPDIALTAYGELARLNTPVRLQTFKRIYHLSEQRRDAAGMLKAANALLKLEPALLAYSNKLDYLRLISGIELDEALDELLHAQNTNPDDKSMALLSKALAASYAGDGAEMKESLEAAASQSSKLEPGPKAVLAGLMWQAGKQEEASAVAKEVGDAEILEEERWFLESIKRD